MPQRIELKFGSRGPVGSRIESTPGALFSCADELHFQHLQQQLIINMSYYPQQQYGYSQAQPVYQQQYVQQGYAQPMIQPMVMERPGQTVIIQEQGGGGGYGAGYYQGRQQQQADDCCCGLTALFCCCCIF